MMIHITVTLYFKDNRDFLGHVVVYLKMGLIDIRKCSIAISVLWKNAPTYFIHLAASFVEVYGLNFKPM